MGLPSLLAEHVVPGPHGLGLQGSGREHWISGLGSGTRPSGHLQNGLPSYKYFKLCTETQENLNLGSPEEYT